MSSYHWQSNHKRSGVDDLVLLSQVSESAICENLKKRFMEDWIFTYIGPVLISVNPFKAMSYFTDKEIEMYQGAATYENPPHVYALADNMYRNMTIDNENQCVIISGESGAGKTVAAKFIMDYISKISGGGDRAAHVKNVVKYSNPLLEAFGNAKTVRNNNSSRFGKYVEIMFNAGQPAGGQISNFLLEKSRVVSQNAGERNFHIFYQMCLAADQPVRDNCGITDIEYYGYLNTTDPRVEGTDDKQDWAEVMEAMVTMGMSEEEQFSIISTVAAVLHLGNVTFREAGVEKAVPEEADALDFPSHLLQISKADLEVKLTSRVMSVGGMSEKVDVTLNVEQAESTRDALAKAVYYRLFEYLVQRVNEAMHNTSKNADLLTTGILDIYGFEIFQKNGFEQFCINFVNEKLQQIFIELTMKAEQEEYVQEGIKWKAIEYFNNQVVCQLIEGKKPPGIFSVLDDVCATMHAVKAGADEQLQGKLAGSFSQHQHFQGAGRGFVIHHYAGMVTYDAEGFCEKNKDVLFVDLIEMVKGSQSTLIQTLFAADQVERGGKKRPTTAGSKIKSQANTLVTRLMQCVPHYVRTIKPNETKRPRDWEHQRVMHQIEYLGLKENVRVRRAGFAYRRPFDKFVKRYEILTEETSPRNRAQFRGGVQQAVEHILKSVGMETSQYQLGKSKLFIKDPASLFLLEEVRERKFDHFARLIQKAFRKNFSRQKLLRQREEAADIFHKKKERRRHSVNRNFYTDYIGLDHKPELRTLVGKREKVEFAQTVDEYNRRFKAEKRDLILTSKAIWLIGRQKVKSGPNKGQMEVAVNRKLDLENIAKVCLSTRQDDIVIIHINGDYASCLNIPLKTELVTMLQRKVKERTNKEMKIVFDDLVEFVTKKGKIGGDKRKVSFLSGTGDSMVVRTSGIITKDAAVYIGTGLPNTTRPKVIQASGNNRNQSRAGQQTQAQSTLRSAPGVPRGGGRGGPVKHLPTTQNDIYDTMDEEETYDTMDNDDRETKYQPAYGTQRGRGRGSFNPGPPRGPAPSQQPQHRPTVKLNRNRVNSMKSATKKSLGPVDMSVLNVPQGGVSKTVRQSMAVPTERPVPGGGRPRPKPRERTVVALPRVRAMYDYEAQDLDEVSLKEGEVLELVKEGMSPLSSQIGRLLTH
eukprot:GFUD01061174.1.p1 GENE.GFUD01061174.1~~GFUD01061174.1.p1  ORF type:complete len:1149 (-),score=317.13 GFUD01061174.1:56-3502(-)